MSNIEALITEAKLSASIMELIASFEPQDIDGDDIDLRFEVDGFDTGCNVSLVEQCGKAAEQLAALIAALEQKEEQRANWFRMAQKLGEDMDEAEKRIAELEAKKPAAFRTDGGDIGSERIKEIADNPYGDEEKCWLARQLLASSLLAVKLPAEINPVHARSLFSMEIDDDQANAAADGWNACIKAIRAAGGTVSEGE